MFPPFAGITYYRDWAPPSNAHCLVMHLFALYLLFLPPLLPLDTETDVAAAAPIDYIVDDLLARATRQAPP